MARNRQIGRSTGAVHEARPSVAQQTIEYRAMLDQDFGKPAFNRAPSVDDGRPVGLIALLARPSGLFVLAVIAFLSVLGIKLWRDGMFDALWAPKMVVIEKDGIRFDPATRLLPPAEEDLPEVSAPKTIDTPKVVAKSEPEPDEEEVEEIDVQ